MMRWGTKARALCAAAMVTAGVALPAASAHASTVDGNVDGTVLSNVHSTTVNLNADLAVKAR